VGTLTSTDGPVVQRAEAEEEEEEMEGMDLAELAQRVYPFVRRLLRIEQERWSR
jgi:hypothetical protein